MRKTKFLITTALATPLTVAPFITSCSCSNNSDAKDLLNDIHKVFGVDPNTKQLSTTACANADAAITEYATNVLNSSDAKKNEILFDCFNFTSKQGLEIITNNEEEVEKSISVTPDDKSFYDLYNSKQVDVSIGYAIDVGSVTKSTDPNGYYFPFTMQGWLTCAYTKDVSSGDYNFKSGDYVQFVFDLNTTSYVFLKATELNNKFYMNVEYTLPMQSTNASVAPCFGFIKMKMNGYYLPDIPITDMAQVNYDSSTTPANCGYNRGYYNKTTA